MKKGTEEVKERFDINVLGYCYRRQVGGTIPCLRHLAVWIRSAYLRLWQGPLWVGLSLFFSSSFSSQIWVSRGH